MSRSVKKSGRNQCADTDFHQSVICFKHSLQHGNKSFKVMYSARDLSESKEPLV